MISESFGVASSNAVTLGATIIGIIVTAVLFIADKTGWANLPDELKKDLNMKDMLSNAVNDQIDDLKDRATETGEDAVEDKVTEVVKDQV